MSLLKDVLDILDRHTEFSAMREQFRKIPELERRLAALESRTNPSTNELVCDHCASPDLVRKGSRGAGHFAALGVKEAVYACQQCGKETAVMIK